jgi:hypothetical protein
MADGTFAIEYRRLFAGADQVNCHSRQRTSCHNEQGHRLEQQRQRLKLGLDASLVGYKYVHDKSSLQPDHAIEIIGTAATFTIADRCHHHFGWKGAAPFEARYMLMQRGYRETIYTTPCCQKLTTILFEQW